MSLSLGRTEFGLPHPTLCRRTIPSRHHRRPWKRRRLKPQSLRCHLDNTPSPFENLSQSLLSLFPSTNTINFIAPTLGLASGIALYFSFKSPKLVPDTHNSENSKQMFDIGEWILFTSSTPFNRFVTLRCPSICSPENELLEDVNEKLVKEDRHFVKLNSGRMTQFIGNGDGIRQKMIYQRICVSTEDGGVVSLDWPENLDLEEERGLDTTVLIIPGTAEGSNESKIRGLVLECLRRGDFPIVMNPRGCAGSPLTTPRLFTAADSDDISTAIQFINKRRPWTTLMGVGWGYGANMLTKYLAESGKRTPLTAAICIDNPFNLEESSRSSVNMDFDQKQTSGLIGILQSNKELFLGRGKGFDVKRALSATNTRDFDKAISMVSYGFDTIEDFYAKSSTRDMVGQLKIPVLFIQNDDGIVPVISVPRSLIAQNPYTSLLLCSYSPYSKVIDDRLSLSWCQNLIIEWLTAVELGLLKGRHPLLKDVDFTISPSASLALMGTPNENGGANNLLNSNDGHFRNFPSETFEVNDMAGSIPGSTQDIVGLPPKSKELEQKGTIELHQTGAIIDAEAVEEVTNSMDTERGQVLQSAQVVMNMLDMTMPNTLSEEQKKNVLNAVGQGETLIKALQDAVPEDVRGKLTSAVSGILENSRSDIKLEKLLCLGHVPDIASGLNSKVREKIGASKPKGEEDFESPDQKKKTNGSDDGSVKADHSSVKISGDVQSSLKANGDGEVQFSGKKMSNELDDGSVEVDQSSSKISQDVEVDNQLSENSQRPNDKATCHSTSNLGSSASDLENVNLRDMENSAENEQLPKRTTAQVPDGENASETSSNREQSSLSGEPGGMEDMVIDKNKHEGDGFNQPSRMESNDNHKHDLPTDKSEVSEAHQVENKSSAPSPASETPLKENEAENRQKSEVKDPSSLPNRNSGASPSFNVSEALDALTGLDDSTQVAVNSVFNVIEDMIDQLEFEKENENVENVTSKSEFDGIGGVNELKEESTSENDLKYHSQRSGNPTSLSGNSIVESGISDNILLQEHPGSGNNHEKLTSLYGGNNSHNSDASITKRFGKETTIKAENSVKNVANSFSRNTEKAPSYLNTFSYGNPFYKEYLKKYLYLKMKNAEPLDMAKTSALYLDYIPEEGQWKLLKREEDNATSVDEWTMHEGDSFRKIPAEIKSRSTHASDVIEPSYVIFDPGEPHEENQEYKKASMANHSIGVVERKLDSAELPVKNLILESLKIEVGRRANAVNIDELEEKLGRDIEHVANAVVMAAENKRLQRNTSHDNLINNLSSLDGDNMLKAILFAVQDTQYLKKLLPVGVIVGTSLAALRKFFNIVTVDGNSENYIGLNKVGLSKEELADVGIEECGERLVKKSESKDDFDHPNGENEDKIVLEKPNNNEVMVGAVTAALGASALIVHQQNTGTNGTSNEPHQERQNIRPSPLVEMPEKSHENIVASLAEKAMAVASPVVPMKDGKLDHERLVAMLSELGQKGGILKLVGKVALLWGGVRGAMSLTDKLISFLRIAERPVLQRILGFGLMVLLLWSPVVVPLLPTLIQCWTTRSPLKIVEFACIIGLYVSLTIMIALWGKRIRKHDDPLLQYGLDLYSIPKIKHFVKGVIGGAILVCLIYSVNSTIGCVHLRWPTSLPLSTSDLLSVMKSYGRMLVPIVQGISTATGVAVVEELVFRSWLPEEIAADLGYHRGIIISGLVFAIFQRSTWEIPGLWLLSLCFSGVRQRSEGSLSIPIGLRTGILASNFVLKTGGFLTYESNFPLWLTGGPAFRPFGGVVGLALSLVLAIIFYPRESLRRKKVARLIREDVVCEDVIT